MFSGAIFADTFITEELTAYLPIGTDPLGSEASVRSLARIFVALNKCIEELSSFYRELVPKPKMEDKPEGIPSIPQPSEKPGKAVSGSKKVSSASRKSGSKTSGGSKGSQASGSVLKVEKPMRVVFPFYTEYPIIDGVKKFTYDRRITSHTSASAVFEATMDSPQDVKETRVVVKFARRYSKEVHEFLADKSLAPSLLHHEVIPGTTIHFVVMEYLDAEEMEENYLIKNKKGIRSLRKALKELHQMGFAFGDLREPNILITKGGDLKLVDFDWCGKADEVHYPININKEIQWPEGVVGGEEIKIDHDKWWFEKLTGTAL